MGSLTEGPEALLELRLSVALALLIPGCIASILDACLVRQFMNSDVFFAFSAISDHFRQVAPRVPPMSWTMPQ
ncbi:hypothetical protein C0Z16_30580 [Paraburkholderia rhynchosiae]|uniref:Uncharacterized protein n=1 Tax=Paraburkholderia rhynchosiae TaxID=487049 RepID=A0ABX4UXE8_9BURK|nr:hypothetical protein C0Z16_30580 [Paraburkholderia rhynchosiae]